MSSPAGTSTRPASQTNGLFLSIIFFVSPLATCIAPRLTPFFFAITSAALVGAAIRQGMQCRELLPRAPAIAVFLLLAAYLFLNATWSADRAEAFGKAALFAGLVIIAFAAVVAALRQEKETLRRAGLSFAAGAFIGALFVLLELLTNGIVTRTAMNWVPLLHPSSPKRLKISDGQVTSIKLSELNQNVNLVLFHLWPGALALMGLNSVRRTVAVVLFFIVIAIAVFISSHDSSQIALIGSSLVVLLAWQWRRPIIRALAVAWCATFLLVIPASLIAYQSGLHMATWLPFSARQRVIIWQFVAEETLEHPFGGVGIESTPVLTKQQRADRHLEWPEGFVAPRALRHHDHNLFLQAFHELGMIGAFLFAVAGVMVVLLIPLLPLGSQPFAAGAFAAFAVVSAFAWGMWQTWFMCAAGLLPLYLLVTTGAIADIGATEQRSNFFRKKRAGAG